MAFDGITMAAMIHELDSDLSGGRINKIAPASTLTVDDVGLYMMGVGGGDAPAGREAAP